MPLRRAARQLLIAIVALPFAFGSVRAEQSQSASVTELSPDRRPTLIVLGPLQGLMLAHHARPLSQSKAEEFARKVGLLVALPIIHDRRRESLIPLPAAWTTGDPDRRFMEQLTGALEPGEANWPWRALMIVKSGDEIDRLVSQLAGQDVAVAMLGFELEELSSRVELSVQADVTLLKGAGTPNESRVRTVIRHLAPQLDADPRYARRSASQFREGAELDNLMSAAALDVSRALAVTVARDLSSAPAGSEPSAHRFGDLAHKPKCRECKADDPVLHEEPGRVWVAPAKLAGTVLSLPTA